MTLAIIQARLGSTRLPWKALLDIGGTAMIQRVIARVRQVRGVDHVVVAVPSGRDAYAMIQYVQPVDFFWSNSVAEHDVLGRFARCVGQYAGVETVMRVTGDCPLWDPRIGEQVLERYLVLAPEVEYAGNIAPGYRDGEDCEVFSADALRRAATEATLPADREHVTPWLRRTCRTTTVRPTEYRSDIKTSVDTLADLERVRAMVGVTESL